MDKLYFKFIALIVFCFVSVFVVSPILISSYSTELVVLGFSLLIFTIWATLKGLMSVSADVKDFINKKGNKENNE